MDDGSRLFFLASLNSNGNWIFIAVLIVLLLLAGYFAGIEIAYASVNKIRLKTRADRGDRRATRALAILGNFDKAITTILICTNVVHISAASITALLVTRQWGQSAVTYSTIVTTIAVFFFGEMLPKSLTKKYSETVSLWASASLSFLMKMLSPLSFLLAAVGKAAAKLTKGDGGVSVTEDELYDIIENLTEDGSIDEQKGDLVHSALEFDDVTAGDILTARVDVAALNVEAPVPDILAEIKRQRHSRLPVYRDSIDHVIGILQIRKFIKAYMRSAEALDIEGLLDEPYFVHSSVKVDELLRELSRRKINLAVVTDSYGGTLGVVTVEDILEELVGEIWDEDDVVVENVAPLGDGRFELAATMQVEEAFEEIGFEDPEDRDFSHKTLGEWAYEEFDNIPREGDSFEYCGLKMTVSQQKERRIVRLLAELPSAPEPDDGKEQQA